MAKYVPYVRTLEGYVERKSYAVFNSSDTSLSPYVYEEPLVGWPESKVYWASEAGPFVGLLRSIPFQFLISAIHASPA